MIAFLSGTILLLVRILNLSQITDFFSRPVMGGFISAGGLLIMLSQLQNVFGVKFASSHYPAVTLYNNLKSLPHANANAVAVGLISIAYLIAVKLVKKRFFPSPVLSQLFEHDPSSAMYATTSNTSDDVLTPELGSANAHYDNINSHGFSLTDEQFIKMEQEKQQLENVRRPSSAAETPQAKPVLLTVFLARTLCDLGPLVVCIFGGIVGYLLGPKALKLTGAVPGGFPAPLDPWYGFSDGLIDSDRLGTILLNSLTVSLVVFLSSIAMAKRLAIQRGEDISTEQELTGIGIASLFYGCLPGHAAHRRHVPHRRQHAERAHAARLHRHHTHRHHLALHAHRHALLPATSHARSHHHRRQLHPRRVQGGQVALPGRVLRLKTPFVCCARQLPRVWNPKLSTSREHYSSSNGITCSANFQPHASVPPDTYK
jgi:hypothetical protein